ncbi:hypothetical protein H5410_050602 [Solanum commersonii]|uniref:Uncharacterized protein n=1 Tax=Solanum commersonii TaxID=4109 RepID=A0A9J5WX88_SOLCO|nr:hypothetical protein H5410_050602 [Solanum commersonii]
MKQDLKTKKLIGQELLDIISERMSEINKIPQKGIIDDNSVRHIARRISFQEIDKESMINDYLEEVKINLLQTITHIDKSDTSMRSETSNNGIAEESQQAETDNILSVTKLQDAEEFLKQMKPWKKHMAKKRHEKMKDDTKISPGSVWSAVVHNPIKELTKGALYLVRTTRHMGSMRSGLLLLKDAEFARSLTGRTTARPLIL